MITLQLWKYAKKHLPLIILGILASGGLGIVTGLPSLFIKSLVDELLISGKIEKTLFFFLLFLGLFTAKAFFMYLSWIMHRVGTAISCMIRKDFFDALINASIEDLNKIPQAPILTHFMTDIAQMQNGIILFFRQGVKSLVETIFLLGIAWYRNPLLTTIALTIMPLLLFFLKKSGTYLRNYAHRAQEALEELHTYFQEIFFGLIEVKIYGAQDREKNYFKAQNQNYFKAAIKSAHFEALIPAIIEFFIFGALCFVLYIGLYQVRIATVTVGDLTSFFMALLLSYQPLRRSVLIIAEIQNGLAAAERIFKTINELSNIQEPIDRTEKISFNNNIVLKNISYAYKKDLSVLKNINLTINQGDRIALIGSSGAGKSTLCNILLGFITPTQGSISIDQEELSAHNKKSWRQNIAYISQAPFIFNSSIKDNIIFGNIDKEPNEFEIEESLRKSGLLYKNKIEKTIIDKKGKELSGGEKQRLILARAFYADRPLLILDEATSALDLQKEKIIASTLNALSQETTIIIIAHKPLLIEKMTRIIKIENGELFEITHELLKRDFIAKKTI